MRKIFITGIGTDVGKTVISAILTEALQADYWKPIQAGFEDGTDKLRVKNWISNTISQFHEEQFLLKEPMSPHAAAELENKNIQLSDFKLPNCNNSNLIIEGAGGLLVPINNTHVVADLIMCLDAEVLLVSRNYLGSINHTLLTLNELLSRKLKISGIIFNGEKNEATESIILSKYKFPFVGRVNFHEEINKNVILGYSSQFKSI
jgi:dethiobiotin synthetase